MDVINMLTSHCGSCGIKKIEKKKYEELNDTNTKYHKYTTMKYVETLDNTHRFMKLEVQNERFEEIIERMEHLMDSQEKKISDLYDKIRVLEIILSRYPVT